MVGVTVREIERTENDTTSDITLDGVKIAELILRDHYYAIDWVTCVEDDIGIDTMRDFLASIEREPYRTLPKDIGVYVDCIDKDERRKFQYETFRNSSSYFRRSVKQVQRTGMTGIRVNAPSMDIWCSGGAYEKTRKLGVISHLDLSQELPYLMQKTHSTRLDDVILPQIQGTLKQQIGRYART